MRPSPPPSRRLARRLWRDRRGATAIEYGLILAIIVIGLFGALNGLADVTVGLWNDIDNKVRTASR